MVKHATGWNPEITKGNQRIYMQEQARQRRNSLTPVNDEGQAKPPFPFSRANELTANMVKITWLLFNFIEAGSLNLLFGEPCAGKSLFALEWAFCIAAGLTWCGLRTVQTDVVIIAGEGHAGLCRRLKALELKYGVKAPARLFISQRPANLSNAIEVQWIADTVKNLCENPGLIIVDTLHRNMDGDENNSQDISRFIANLDGFVKPLGAAVLVVHHSGHGQKDRSRGSSSIRAAMDGEFSATKDGGAITLKCHKAKDFEALKPMQFSLKQVELDWFNEDGEPLTSVYLEHGGEALPTAKRRKLTPREDAILTSLGEALAAYGVEPTAEIKAKFGVLDSLLDQTQKIVSTEHWRELAYQEALSDCKTDDARRVAFKRSQEKLINQAGVVVYDNYAWFSN